VFKSTMIEAETEADVARVGARFLFHPRKIRRRELPVRRRSERVPAAQAPVRSHSQVRDVMAGAAVLFAVFVLASTSIFFRPEGTAWSAWWPASGVAIGYAARIERRRLWLVAAALGTASAAGSLVNGRELGIVVWAGVAVTAEVWVGATILRSRADRSPRLENGSDLTRLLACALLASVTLGILGGAGVAAVRGVDDFLSAVVAAIPAHAAGVLLITPLIIRRRREAGGAGVAEAVGIWITLAAVIYLTFGWNVGLPLAFLASAPLTWGATRLAPRNAFLLVMVAAAAVSISSLIGRGPFAIGVLDAEVSVLMVQLFILSFAIVCLTVIVLTSNARRLARAVQENAALFRGTFDHSPIGSAVVTKTSTGLHVSEVNSAARRVAGLSSAAPIIISDHLSEESLAVLTRVLGSEEATEANGWRGIMTLRDERHLDVLINRLPSELNGDTFIIRFFDVTNELRAQRNALEDLARAGEVQRALLPKETSPLPGFDIAAAYVPARTVGGDFYDWYRIEGGLALSLGDVMGKGVGAGMIAATTRAALRSARRDSDAAAAVARAADTLNTDIGDLGSFTTLFHARLNASDGRLYYVDAGHGLTLLLRADGTTQHLVSTDFPLGIDPDSHWTAYDETIGPGDTLIAVSDGVLDLYDGTLAALDYIAELGRSAGSATELASTLANRAREKNEPEDDSTIVVVRRNTQPI
jgi:sigma-B regulation protein RsbU (phosphoserine phosphatase)